MVKNVSLEPCIYIFTLNLLNISRKLQTVYGYKDLRDEVILVYKVRSVKVVT